MDTNMFAFEPDELQKECFGHIDNNDNLLVCIPTGCGKTVIGEYAIYHNLTNSKKSIYTSPIKSLSNEKYKDFRDKYGQERVGIMTGDIQINPTADIVIMTTEILRNDLHKNKTDDNLGCVIFDEVHYINDEDRGTIWEETLILLKSDIQLILLSATINNPNCFTSWLSNIKQKPMRLVLSYKRPVPLIHYTYCYDKMYKIMEKDIYKHEIYDEMVRDYKKEYSH
jgi:antiviral helicase SKI2